MATTYLPRTARHDSVAPMATTSGRTKLSIGLWAAQVVLALVFAMAGSMKLLMPADVLQAQTPLPIELVRFIGVCEVAGALGMILPGLLRIQTGLTPLAAAGMVVLMICATVLTPILIAPDPVMTLVPFTVGVLAAFVGYGRSRVAPLRSRA